MRQVPMARDFPKPNVEDTDPYREANALSSRFRNDLRVSGPGEAKKVPTDPKSLSDGRTECVPLSNEIQLFL